MNTLIKVIIRFHFLLLFIVLETISLSIYVSEDITKKKVLFSSANFVSGFFHNKINNWKSYFILADENENLRNENLKLKNNLQLFIDNPKQTPTISDSTKYLYISGRVINNTVFKGKNYLTIDKGKIDGIEKDFGVIGHKGVVGIVATVSNHYSLVVSLLNKRIALSARLKKNNFFGTLKWDGEDYRYANLTEIPNHIKIGIGDTVVSSGFSAVFPENLNLGVIYDINNNESNNFYDLKVKLSTDFKSIKNVYFIKNQQKEEQLNLETIAKDEY